MERTWKEAVMSAYGALSWHLCGGNEENLIKIVKYLGRESCQAPLGQNTKDSCGVSCVTNRVG
jgi:hypothetical protein